MNGIDNLIKKTQEQSNSNLNNLECIRLHVSDLELENGCYSHFLNQIKNTIKINSINYYFSKKIDFRIVTTSQNKSIDTFILDSLFKSIDVVFSDLSVFETIDYFKSYNTTLFLGCDCYLSEDWLERIYNYTRFCGSFWISGPFHNSDEIDVNFSLYSTGDLFFLDFIQFILNEPLAKTNPNNIKSIIKTYFNDEEILDFVNTRILFNNLILNYEKNNLDILKIMKKYNCSILNKKSNISSCKDIKEIKIDPNFDFNFYLSNYTKVKDYYLDYCKMNGISDEIRAYHHYVNFGRHIGYLINEKEKNDSKIKLEDIDKY